MAAMTITAQSQIDIQALIDKISANGGGRITFPKGELPSWGLYLRHIRNITLKNVQLSLTSDDFRPEIVEDDVEGLVVFPK